MRVLQTGSSLQSDVSRVGLQKICEQGVVMHEGEDEHRGYAGKEETDRQRISEREFARPQ
jgi:hypothetical protein